MQFIKVELRVVGLRYTPDSKNKFSHAFQLGLVTWGTMIEVTNWLKKNYNYGENYLFRRGYAGRLAMIDELYMPTVYFLNEADAMAFKLAWQDLKQW